MRLLLTISDFRGGGAEREFATLLSQIDYSRFEPHVCFWRSIFDYPPPTNIPYAILNKNYFWDTPRTVVRLARLIDEFRPEVIFSQLHFVNLVTGTALALSNEKPAWVCRQVNDPRREMPWPIVHWARWALRKANSVVGCCDGVSSAMSEYLRLDPAHVQTLRNIVDIKQIDKLAREPISIKRFKGKFVVVNAGRFCWQKNQSLLLNAVAMLNSRSIELWMLGDGPLSNRLRSQAEKLGIADQVRWLGFQSNPYSFFSQADCFVLSSDHEGSPNVLLEAMLCNCAVVATNCRYGPDEIIQHSETGYLTPTGNAEELASAISNLMDSPDTRLRMASAGNASIRKDYETRMVSENYMKLFEDVAARNTR